jgi:hypothetical protein
MVVFVRHAFLLRGVGFDINNIADTIGHKVRRHLNEAMFCPSYRVAFTGDHKFTVLPKVPIGGPLSARTFETPLEHVARTRAVTERVRHGSEM